MFLESLSSIPQNSYGVLVGLMILYVFLLVLVMNPMNFATYVVFALVLYTQVSLVFFVLASWVHFFTCHLSVVCRLLCYPWNVVNREAMNHPVSREAMHRETRSPSSLALHLLPRLYADPSIGRIYIYQLFFLSKTCIIACVCQVKVQGCWRAVVGAEYMRAAGFTVHITIQLCRNWLQGLPRFEWVWNQSVSTTSGQ